MVGSSRQCVERIMEGNGKIQMHVCMYNALVASPESETNNALSISSYTLQEENPEYHIF